MLKKSLVLMSVSAAFFMQAQDISVLRNSIDVYSNTPMTGSSKFNAMAGSNGALGGDASSLLTNPAGIGVAISGDVSGTLSITNNKNRSSLGGSSINYNINRADLGNVGGVAAFQLMSDSGWKFLNVGVNFSNQSIENYVESPGNGNIMISKSLLDSNNNPVTGNLTYLGHAYNRYGTQSKMNIGVGANYENFLYLGAGLNFHYADVEQHDTAVFGLDLDNSVSAYDKQYTPYTEKSNGFSASFGVIGKVSKEFRLGATLETPTWWRMDRLYNEYGLDSQSYMVSGVFGETVNFRSPMKATFSGAFVPNKNFALNVDYTLGLTKPKYSEDSDVERELNSFFSDNYKNLSEVRVGAEYRIQGFRLRGGYSYATSPFDSGSVNTYANNGTVGSANYNNWTLGQRNTFGLGLGYDFGGFYIDASYQNISSKYNNPFLYGKVIVDNGNPTQYVSTGYNSGNFDVVNESYAVSDVKNTFNNFFITLGWKF
ncbi:OmpP1/FadL family transporter [Chryseobacterium nematophagum]|nr:hemin receptor [Chryseobacterium nematophagum]